jgi:hypothetical protein
MNDHDQGRRLCLGRPRVLAVIDPNDDARETLKWFHALGVRNLDFLLPDASYSAPPRHIEGYRREKLLDWLVTAFDAWVALDDPELHVRIFDTGLHPSSYCEVLYGFHLHVRVFLAGHLARSA